MHIWIFIKVIVLAYIGSNYGTHTNWHGCDWLFVYCSEPWIDGILTSSENWNLQTFLAVGFDKCPSILEVRMFFQWYFFSSDTVVVGEWFTFESCYYTDFIVTNLYPVDFITDFKHTSIDTIATRH